MWFTGIQLRTSLITVFRMIHFLANYAKRYGKLSTFSNKRLWRWMDLLSHKMNYDRRWKPWNCPTIKQQYTSIVLQVSNYTFTMSRDKQNSLLDYLMIDFQVREKKHDLWLRMSNYVICNINKQIKYLFWLFVSKIIKLFTYCSISEIKQWNFSEKNWRKNVIKAWFKK